MTFLIEALLVGAGGFIGSALRFVVSTSVHRLISPSLMPMGTLVVNVAGCLAIGLLASIAESRQLFEAGQRLFLFAGILGGFTTFSAFAFETLGLVQDGAWAKAIINVTAQVLLGIVAAVAGYELGRNW